MKAAKEIVLNREDGSEYIMQTEKYTVEEILSLNQDMPDEVFSIDYASGTEVVDVIVGVTYTVGAPDIALDSEQGLANKDSATGGQQDEETVLSEPKTDLSNAELVNASSDASGEDKQVSGGWTPKTGVTVVAIILIGIAGLIGVVRKYRKQ